MDDERKFRELILYLCRLSADDPAFASVKLNKLLFFIDFEAFHEWGHSVSGQEYAKRPQGPCPRRLVPVRQELVNAGSLTVEDVEYHGFAQKRPVAQREPDLTVFTAEEKRLIEETVQRWWNVTGTEISDTSHQFVGWQLARDGESIPYEVAVLERLEPTPAEVEWARELESRSRARRAG